MPLSRVLPLIVQAYSHQWAFQRPNQTVQDQRYHTSEPWFLQIAPAIFTMHHVVAWICTFFELALSLFHPASSFSSARVLSAAICPFNPTPETVIHTSAIFYVGFVLAFIGLGIRRWAFRTMAELFTFDLTVQPGHRLITSGPYRYVRHPAYSGSLILVLGLTLSHLTRGSWLVECTPLAYNDYFRAAFVLGWWSWVLAVGVSRSRAEDGMMHERFGKEWEEWAGKVRWWMISGVL